MVDGGNMSTEEVQHAQTIRCSSPDTCSSGDTTQRHSLQRSIQLIQPTKEDCQTWRDVIVQLYKYDSAPTIMSQLREAGYKVTYVSLAVSVICQ